MKSQSYEDRCRLLGEEDRIMTAEDVRKMLREACDAAGGMSAWGARNSIGVSNIADVLSGRRKPGRVICAALGIVRREDYDEIRR